MKKIGIIVASVAIVSLGVTVFSFAESSLVAKTASLARQYRLKDLSEAPGVWPTKDGGYILAGTTIWDRAFADEDAFLAKTDARGGLVWSRLFQSATYGKGGKLDFSRPGGDYGLFAAELTGGGYLLAGSLEPGFNDDEYLKYKESWGDIFLTRFDTAGRTSWTKMLGDYGYDKIRGLEPLADGGWFLLGSISGTGYGNDIADQQAIPTFTVMDRYRADGVRQSLKKINVSDTTLSATADGWVGVGELATVLPTTGIGIKEVTMGSSLPVVFKLDKDANLLWSKTIESIPWQMNTVQSIDQGKPTMGPTVMRLAGGQFKTVVATPDGGALALGFLSQLATTGLNYAGDTNSTLVAVKFDPAGAYQWAHTVSLDRPVMDGAFFDVFKAIVAKDGNLVLLGNVTQKDDGQDAKRAAYVKAIGDFYAGFGLQPGEEEKTAASKKAWKALLEQGETAERMSRKNSVVVKTDLDFKPIWSKAIGQAKAISLTGLVAMPDGGVVMSGEHETDDLNFIRFGEKRYFHDAALVRLDANGDLSGNPDIVGDFRLGGVGDVSSYITTGDAALAVSDFKYAVDKSPKPRIVAQKTKVGTLAPWQEVAIVPIATPTTTGATTPATTKTWSEISFDLVKEVPIENEKGKLIDADLRPILKIIYGDQVKVTDSLAGMWIDYAFPRPATRADVVEVEKCLAGLGYKIDESEEGNLYVSKIGFTLHLNFRIQNAMAGKMEVTY